MGRIDRAELVLERVVGGVADLGLARVVARAEALEALGELVGARARPGREVDPAVHAVGRAPLPAIASLELGRAATKRCAEVIVHAHPERRGDLRAAETAAPRGSRARFFGARSGGETRAATTIVTA